MKSEVRVRFAPSPTGPLHIGGVRTALYNYLFAKKAGGDMLLRIEDTDQARYVPGAEQYIVDSLKWCGIQFNEGVDIGGPYKPYRQSERKEIYRQYAMKLISEGRAYYAFDTPRQLDQLRKQAESDKRTFQYDSSVRMSLDNSLTLNNEQLLAKFDTGEPYVIRIMIPENEEIVVNDLIRGEVRVQSGLLDDKVLFKSDGLPTYHLANVVDDYLMKISHVIRGEEWLPSAPLHVLLYRYLGWEADMPKFAHLPLLLKPDGNGKLSKRDGDRLGFPVFPLQWTDPVSGEISSGYREAGYFPEAFINMLAFLGWNPGTRQEIFSMDELIEQFSLEKVGKAGSKFDPEKARWFNHQYLQMKSDKEIAGLVQKTLRNNETDAPFDYVVKVCGLVKNRLHFTDEFWAQASYFFRAPQSYDAKAVKEKWKAESPEVMKEVARILVEMPAEDAEGMKQAVIGFINEKGLGTGQIMNALRLLIVGASLGPDLFQIIEMIGKKEAVLRITNGILALNDHSNT